MKPNCGLIIRILYKLRSNFESQPLLEMIRISFHIYSLSSLYDMISWLDHDLIIH